VKDILLGVQKDLLTLGAELSTLPGDISKLTLRIGDPEVRRIENLIDELQQEVTLKNEFIYPGESVASAQIDVGRTVIRRAERKAARLKKEKLMNNDFIHQYLNRLADMLFTLARYEEQKG
jgi:cob(I)alamin adenosyltransferase